MFFVETCRLRTESLNALHGDGMHVLLLGTFGQRHVEEEARCWGKPRDRD